MLPIRTALRTTRPLTARPILIRTPIISIPTRRAYHEKDKYSLIDHYTRPRNVGSLNGKDPNVGSGLVGAPACGDVMKLDIQVDEKTGTIIDARFKTFGCGSAIASSSYATTLVKGMRLEDAAKIKNVDIASELCLPPVKLHCSMLAEDAIKAAIANYKSKRPAGGSSLAGTGKTIADAAATAQPTATAAGASA